MKIKIGDYGSLIIGCYKCTSVHGSVREFFFFSVRDNKIIYEKVKMQKLTPTNEEHYL